MEAWLRHLLEGPGDPSVLTVAAPWVRPMIGCAHDSRYHAEGDPWTHTAMVADVLERSPGFADLPEARRLALRLAAWMHDMAKPAVTEIAWCETEKRMRVRQPGHAPLGARMAWRALLDAGCDALVARDVHALVFWHQRPFHMLGQSHTEARVLRFAAETVETPWDDLLRLCRADNLGRVSPGIRESLAELDLLETFIAEQGAPWDVDLRRGPWPYVNAEARLAFLRSLNGAGSPHLAPPEPRGSRVAILSGLPGSGKSTFLRRALPGLEVVSLDAIRADLDIPPDAAQGRVLQAAFEAARVHLREGRNFAWDATCLTRALRRKIVGLARDYDAQIEIFSLDVPLRVALQRNAGRPRPVPEGVIEALAEKREPALADEAHQVWSVDVDGRARPCLAETARIETPAFFPEMRLD